MTQLDISQSKSNLSELLDLAIQENVRHKRDVPFGNRHLDKDFGVSSVERSVERSMI